MTESDSTAPTIHIVHAETQDFGIGFDDCGKRLVELPDGNVGFRQVRLFQELLYHSSGGNREVDRI